MNTTMTKGKKAAVVRALIDELDAIGEAFATHKSSRPGCGFATVEGSGASPT